MTGSVHRYHVEKDAVVGSKHIKDATIPYGKLESNTIQFIIPLQLIKDANGLAADSVGVKYTSGKFKINTRHLKNAIIRATWTASAADSVTAIELYNVTDGSIVGSISGNTGTDLESSDLAGAITDGDMYELRVDVTTASATAGATTSVAYAILELTYGIS